MATWRVDNLISYDTYGELSGVVHAVEYTVLHSSGSISCSIGQLINLDISDLSSFTAYNSLTESTVLGWVKAALGADEVAALENVAEVRVEEKGRDNITVGKAW